MFPEAREPVDLDARLQRLGMLLLEATAFYLVLAAWARPRAGPGGWLPLVVCLALPAALGLRQLVSSSSVSSAVQQITIPLAAATWGLLAARLVAPADYWARDLPGGMQLLGVVLGNQPGVGLQPLAFWASVLRWWRGPLLPDWDPPFDDVLGRFRLAAVIVGAAVLLAAGADGAGSAPAIQIEQAICAAVFLAGGLLTTAAARRREMAGAGAAGRAGSARNRAGGRDFLAFGLVAGLALLLLCFAALAARELTPAVFAPLVDLGARAVAEAGAGLSWLAGSVGGLFGSLLPPTQPAQPSESEPPLRGLLEALPALHLSLPDWIGMAVFIISLAMLTAGGIMLVVLARRSFAANLAEGIAAVVGSEHGPTAERRSVSPTAVVGLLIRLLRGARRVGRARARGAARPGARPATLTESPPIQSAYGLLLAWAAEQGLSRRPHETPDELLERLTAACPEAAAALRLLTALYVDQRYGRASNDSVDADRAQVALAQLRSKRASAPAAPPGPLRSPARPG